MNTSIRNKSQANFLPVGERQIGWGLYLTGAGHEIMAPGEEFTNEGRPVLYHLELQKGRILPEYVFLYLKSGGCYYESEHTSRLKLDSGAFFMLFPGIWHRLIPDPKTGFQVLWFACNGSYLQNLTEKKILNPESPVVYLNQSEQLTAAQQMLALVDQVLTNPQENRAQYVGDIVSYITKIHFIDNQEDENQLAVNNSFPEQIVQMACREIWNWGHRDIDIEQLSKKMKTSRRTLERYFVQCLGRTIRAEIHRCRVYRAISLLQQTNIKIEQIALMAGFPSYNHMSRVFKRFLDKSPRDFRS